MCLQNHMWHLLELQMLWTTRCPAPQWQKVQANSWQWACALCFAFFSKMRNGLSSNMFSRCRDTPIVWQSPAVLWDGWLAPLAFWGTKSCVANPSQFKLFSESQLFWHCVGSMSLPLHSLMLLCHLSCAPLVHGRTMNGICAFGCESSEHTLNKRIYRMHCLCHHCILNALMRIVSWMSVLLNLKWALQPGVSSRLASWEHNSAKRPKLGPFQ